MSNQGSIRSWSLLMFAALLNWGPSPCLAQDSAPPTSAPKDEAPPPTIEAIAAIVKMRERSTLPRGVDYEFDFSHAGDFSGRLLTQSLWLDGTAQVWRRIGESPGQELVIAWDGKSMITAARGDGESGRWKGNVSAERTNAPHASCFFNFFMCANVTIGTALGDGGARVLGWSNVDGHRCVAVHVTRPDIFSWTYDLDPALNMFPRRVIMSCAPDQRLEGSRPHPIIQLPLETDDPNAERVERKLFEARVASEFEELDVGVFVPTRVSSILDEEAPSRIHGRATSWDRVENVEPGNYGLLLTGIGRLTITETGQQTTFGIATEELVEEYVEHLDDSVRELQDLGVGKNANQMKWPRVLIGVLVGLLLTFLLVKGFGRKGTRGDAEPPTDEPGSER